MKGYFFIVLTLLIATVSREKEVLSNWQKGKLLEN